MCAHFHLFVPYTNSTVLQVTVQAYSAKYYDI